MHTFSHLLQRIVMLETNESLEQSQDIHDIYNKIKEQEKIAISNNSKTLSTEEFDKFEWRLQHAKMQIYKNYPFFGLILSRLKTVPSFDIPTMAVDNNNNIYINPHFTMNVLTFPETIGVLMHEAFHHINQTFYRRKQKHTKLWNIATDYIMNRDILTMGAQLPSLGLNPKLNGTDNTWRIDWLDNLDITDMTAEELYNVLLAKQEAGGNKISNNIDEATRKQEDFDRHIEPGEAPPGSIEVPSDEEVYKPNKDDGKTEEEKEVKRKTVVSQIAEEIRRHKTNSGSGSTPRSFDFNKILQPKTNWKSLLRNFISKNGSTEYTWSRPAKRALAVGYYAPKERYIKDKLDIVIAIDTSGSIPNKVVHTFLYEVLKLNTMFKADIKVLFYHDAVYKEIKINHTTPNSQILNEIDNTKLQAGGNTESCIKAYLTKQGITKLNGFLLFTDGYIQSTPDFPQAKHNLFMIVNNGSDEIVKKFGPVSMINIE
jgi:predicted metal-dependent peptidase